MLSKLDFEKLKEKTKKEILHYLKEKDNAILFEIQNKIINYIFKNLTEHDNFKNNKLYFGMPLWIKAYKNDIFRKNADIVNSLTIELKVKSFIGKSSRDYPKNNCLFSINPLNNSFINSRISTMDETIELRKKLLLKLKNYDFYNDKDRNLEYEVDLFIFLKLFLIDKIPNTYFQYLNRRNILYVNNKVIFVIKEEEENGFIPLNVIIFDRFTSLILNQIFPKNNDSLFKVHDKFFSKDYHFYYHELEKYCKKSELIIKDIKNNIYVEYLINQTPLSLALRSSMNHPKISLFEIEKLFPNTVSKELLQIESSNYKIYRNINQHETDNDSEIVDDFDDDFDDELDLRTELNIKFDVYEKLTDIVKVPDDYKSIPKYVKDWNDFMNIKKNQDDRLIPIFNHLKYLLNKILLKDILSKTLNGYLRVLFDYCFDFYIKAVNLEEAIRVSNYKLKNSGLSPDVQIQYQSRILIFYKQEFNLTFNKINTVINYNRSVVFEDELDRVVKKFIYADKKLYKDEILINRRAVFTIVAYYSGLRKGELFSRLFKDFSYISDNKFSIDVNRKGINIINKYIGKKVVSLKNSNAKRAFEFEITNTKHLNIVKKYYDNLEKNDKVRFLFPGNNKNQTILKYRVINISKLNEINSILQDSTKRYTVIHSFRHSYITNEIKKLLNKKDKRIEDIFDLIYRVGHAEPETTIKNYAHLCILKILE